MSITRTIAALIAVSLGGTALASGTGSHGHDSKGSEPSYGQPGDPKKVTRTIQVSGEEYAYAPQAFTAKKGEVVKFVFHNKGTEDHELTIGDRAMQLAHRKMMAEMANQPAMTGHDGHGGHDHHAMGNVVTAKPGETKELVWEFTQSGDFELACNIPGHAESGMEAKISVK